MTVSSYLGIISIILGVGLIVKTWEYPFWALGGMLAGMGVSEGLIGLFPYILATAGLIVSGIGMLRQKKWAAILFVILLILWGSFLFLRGR